MRPLTSRAPWLCWAKHLPLDHRAFQGRCYATERSDDFEPAIQDSDFALEIDNAYQSGFGRHRGSSQPQSVNLSGDHYSYEQSEVADAEPSDARIAGIDQ